MKMEARHVFKQDTKMNRTFPHKTLHSQKTLQKDHMGKKKKAKQEEKQADTWAKNPNPHIL